MIRFKVHTKKAKVSVTAKRRLAAENVDNKVKERSKKAREIAIELREARRVDHTVMNKPVTM